MGGFIRSTSLLMLITLVLIGLEFSIPLLFFKLFNTNYNGKTISSMLFLVGATFLFFLIIPIAFSQFAYKEKLNNLGLATPKNYIETILLTLLSLLILIPFIVLLAKQGPFQIYYSLNQPNQAKLMFVLLTIFPLLYFCEEFFFRGFLLMNLWRNVKWHSLWITDILFTLAHIAKPPMEVIVALPAGIILALLTLRTKSIYPAIVVHYMLGIIMILMTNGVI